MKRRFSKTVRSLFRGSGQVMFQGNGWTGLWFLAGIGWGAWVNGNPNVVIGAVVGLAVSTLVGWVLHLPMGDGRNGLWGFNGILVGCAFPTFLAPTPWMWVSLVACAAFTVWLRTGLDRALKPLGCSSLTFPFVFATWLFLLAARDGQGMPLLVAAPHGFVAPGGADLWIEAWLKGVGQVFLVDSWVAGLCMLIGLYLSSRWACLWAMVGSAVSILVAGIYGAPLHEVWHGLYSYSAVLTAIALGCTFQRPSWRSALWTLVGIGFTVMVQAAFDRLLLPWGIPPLTGPFCLTTWLFLWPGFRLEERKS